MMLGPWLSRLIEQAADKAAVADVPADDLAALLAHLERLEQAVFVADKSDTADTADTETAEPRSPTRSPVSDTEIPASATGMASFGARLGAAMSATDMRQRKIAELTGLS